MRLKLISLFLSFLFSIVIAFPGYGLGTASAKVKSSIQVKAKKTPSTPISWKSLLKKCLAKGINVIEEERNIEEDEDSESSCKEVCYLISSHHYKLFAPCKLQYAYHMEEHALMSMRSVPYPPPNCN